VEMSVKIGVGRATSRRTSAVVGSFTSSRAERDSGAEQHDGPRVKQSDARRAAERGADAFGDCVVDDGALSASAAL
jgi:hypothetical protein